jgi:hypothetical protein
LLESCCLDGSQDCAEEERGAQDGKIASSVLLLDTSYTFSKTLREFLLVWERTDYVRDVKLWGLPTRNAARVRTRVTFFSCGKRFTRGSADQFRVGKNR